MRVRPGRGRSLLGGVMALIVTFAGVAMMSSMRGMGGPFSFFIWIWLAIGLSAAGMAFYNAFSREGLPLYEVDMDRPQSQEGSFCPQCGKRIGPDDAFCRHCGQRLEENR